MKLIVGLGNPGKEYVGTRHNIGFDVLDAFAQRQGWMGRGDSFERLARGRFDGLTLDGAVSLPSRAGQKVVLLKPLTFMNLSGKAVQAAMAFFQVSPLDLMVVLDDLALPVGRLRIRPGGSSGGHNGLKDIERMLGTTQYPRLRIGIDPPPPRVPGRDYVLGRFSEPQRDALPAVLARASDALTAWMDKDINWAMSQFNAPDDTRPTGQ